MPVETTERIAELIRERQKAAALVRGIDQHLASIRQRPDDLLLAIGEAEERGDWPLASRLRNQRLSQRLSRDDPSR
jgi:hypothetical protein